MLKWRRTKITWKFMYTNNWGFLWLVQKKSLFSQAINICKYVLICKMYGCKKNQAYIFALESKHPSLAISYLGISLISIFVIWCCEGSYLRFHSRVWFIHNEKQTMLNEIWRNLEKSLIKYQNFFRFYLMVSLIMGKGSRKKIKVFF